MKVDGYSQFGATERTAGAIRNILDYEGVVAPHTREPFTEALLMGIGGGLGAEYATWAFTPIDPSRPRKTKLYLRFRHVKNYIEKNEESLLPKIANRLGVTLTVKETASKDRAKEFLIESLKSGKPVITYLSVWHSQYLRREVKEQYNQDPNFFPPLLYDEHVNFLPYFTLPYPWINHNLTIIYGFDEETNQVSLTDSSTQPHILTIPQFNLSRGILKSRKNAGLVLDPPLKIANLHQAVRAGIHDCVESLLHEKSVVSGANLRVETWNAIAKTLANPTAKRGWLTLFNEGWQLFDTLTRLHAQITFHNSDGGALRSSYSDFLQEASDILKKPQLREIANQFANIGIMWDDLSVEALPDDIPQLQVARRTALEWNTLFKIHGEAAKKRLDAAAMKIQTIRAEVSEMFPLTEKELIALFQDLSTRFAEIYEAEKVALKALKNLF
ncbi:MAG: BtrH N-terminal domain-containing protein [Candidatus Hermodarchaeota archaeon]